MRTTEDLISEGKALKTYRKLIGMKQKDAAILLKTEQGNYSRMENGRLNAGWRIARMWELFNDWRTKEIIRLEKRIEYLKSL